MSDAKDKLLVNNHLTPPPPVINTENEVVEFESEEDIAQDNKFIKCVEEIQSIFNKGYSPENGKRLIDFVQKQRSLVLELMLQSFLNRPDPKMGDSLNTLMAQIEKSVRDDRKEALKAKEMETSKETFELFAKTLGAVTSGQITIPTFGATALVLDPMKPLVDPKEAKIKPEELQQGNVLVDAKMLEAVIFAPDPASSGNEIVPPTGK